MSDDDRTIAQWNELVKLCGKKNEQEGVKPRGVPGPQAMAVKTAIDTNPVLYRNYLSSYTRKHINRRA